MPIEATRPSPPTPATRSDPASDPPQPSRPSSRQSFENLRDHFERNPTPRFGSYARTGTACEVVAAGPETHVERVLREVRTGKAPLRVVFCNQYGNASDHTFGANAARMAAAIDAVRPEAGDALELGVTPVCDKNIAAPLREVALRCGRKVAEVHVFGHVGHGVQRSRAWAQAIRPFVEPDVKIVLHGCYQANNAEHLRATLLAELPEARVYGHWTGSESGMPYQFARVDREGVTALDDVTPEVLPDGYRDGWLDAQAANGAAKLRSLLRSPGVDDEMRREIEARLEALRKETADAK